ncbi:MFS general substrate transporter [Roridomyces roridus]|uniref:MFS general substrate transporter n=1 Tax=Roridomyces roridus TaxID=1738132 RepID=A0AAD7FIK9_9AGAR|nr:MFS general substrate transporter [Roridomyces roridus]
MSSQVRLSGGENAGNGIQFIPCVQAVGPSSKRRFPALLLFTMDVAEKEKASSVGAASSSEAPLKVDHVGLPLIPQPSDDPEDPLNWSRRQKYVIVFIVALVAFMGTFALASSNPAYAQIGEAIGVSAIQASYIGTISIAAAGIGSFVWAPISNVYGRRPVLIFSQAIAIAAGFGSSYAKTYGTIIVGRFFVGLGVASGNVVSFAVISDVFCLHERGKMLGVVTVALINGPHLASLPGGFIAQNVGWRWTMLMSAIFTSVCWVLILVGLPETLYVRGVESALPTGRYYRYRITGSVRGYRRLQLVDFARPFQMLRYFPVVVVAWFGAVAFTLGSVMPAQTVSALFRTYYRWGSARTGVALSVSTTIGGVLGEVVSGPVIDKLMERARRREGRVRPEARLHGMWPAIILLPGGLLMFGFSIQNHELKHSYIGATVGMAMTCFAVQMITTPIIAYCVDCYKPQSAEVVQLLNFARQEMSFTVGFWSIRYGDRVGFQFSGLTYACVSVLFFLPVLWVMIYGERVREKLGEPEFNKDI